MSMEGSTYHYSVYYKQPIIGIAFSVLFTSKLLQTLR